MTSVIGHRGAARLAPESTRAGFETALKHNIDAIEFDVRRAADRPLVVCHDETASLTSAFDGAALDRVASSTSARASSMRLDRSSNGRTTAG